MRHQKIKFSLKLLDKVKKNLKKIELQSDNCVIFMGVEVKGVPHHLTSPEGGKYQQLFMGREWVQTQFLMEVG